MTNSMASSRFKTKPILMPNRNNIIINNNVKKFAQSGRKPPSFYKIKNGHSKHLNADLKPVVSH